MRPLYDPRAIARKELAAWRKLAKVAPRRSLLAWLLGA